MPGHRKIRRRSRILTVLGFLVAACLTSGALFYVLHGSSQDAPRDTFQPKPLGKIVVHSAAIPAATITLQPQEGKTVISNGDPNSAKGYTEEPLALREVGSCSTLFGGKTCVPAQTAGTRLQVVCFDLMRGFGMLIPTDLIADPKNIRHVSTVRQTDGAQAVLGYVWSEQIKGMFDTTRELRFDYELPYCSEGIENLDERKLPTA